VRLSTSLCVASNSAKMRLAAVLLLLHVACVCATLPVIPSYVSQCRTAPELASNSSFVSVMNRCLAINTPISLPLAIVHQVLDWLQVTS
jgi:hypothetical protein